MEYDLIVLAVALIGSVFVIYFRKPILSFLVKFKIIPKLREVADILELIASDLDLLDKYLEDDKIDTEEAKDLIIKVKELKDKFIGLIKF